MAALGSNSSMWRHSRAGAQVPHHYSSNYTGFWLWNASTASWHFLPRRSRPPQFLTTCVLYCSYIITTPRFVTPFIWTETGKCAYQVSTLTIWNYLPSGAWLSDSLVTFKRQIKTTVSTVTVLYCYAMCQIVTRFATRATLVLNPTPYWEHTVQWQFSNSGNFNRSYLINYMYKW